MEDVGRDTYQDRLANFTTDTNGTSCINIYLNKRSKSDLFTTR